MKIIPQGEMDSVFPPADLTGAESALHGSEVHRVQYGVAVLREDQNGLKIKLHAESKRLCRTAAARKQWSPQTIPLLTGVDPGVGCDRGCELMAMARGSWPWGAAPGVHNVAEIRQAAECTSEL